MSELLLYGSTFSRTPETPKTQHETLHPNLQTLNPQFYTRNPKPKGVTIAGGVGLVSQQSHPRYVEARNLERRRGLIT